MKTLHSQKRVGRSSVVLLALVLPVGFLGLLNWATGGSAPIPSPYLATLPSQGPDLLNDLDDTPPSTPLRDPCPAGRSVAGAPGSGESASASPETDPCLPAYNVTMVPFDPQAPAVPCPNGRVCDAGTGQPARRASSRRRTVSMAGSPPVSM